MLAAHATTTERPDARGLRGSGTHHTIAPHTPPGNDAISDPPDDRTPDSMSVDVAGHEDPGSDGTVGGSGAGSVRYAGCAAGCGSVACAAAAGPRIRVANRTRRVASHSSVEPSTCRATRSEGMPRKYCV